MTSYEDETHYLPDTLDTRKGETDGDAAVDATPAAEVDPTDAAAEETAELDAPEADATAGGDGAADAEDVGPTEDGEVTADTHADAATPDGAADTSACDCPPGLVCDDAGRCVDNICGNGVLETGETCDPPAACPTFCDDAQPCSLDTLVGDAASCTARCEQTPILTCRGGDACCPQGCTAGTDGDCSASCGDGMVHPPETCDPPASCPGACDDEDACTADQLLGSAAACSATCSHVPIVACQGGDGCCPAGCNALADDDCEPVCNNGVVEPGETCDPPASCPNSCNDGNACTSDVMSGVSILCTRTCTHTTVTACSHTDGCCPAGCNAVNDRDCDPVCGNAVVEAGETCDPPGSCPTSCNDGNACTRDTLSGSSASCTRACSFSAITTCTGGDGCCPSGCNAVNDRDCQPKCGNNVVEAGETCDPPGSCPTTCNDSNACTTDTATGSSATCTRACSYTAITTCTSGDGCCRSGCTALNDSDCPAVCGNGLIEPGETCDPNSSCPTSCDDANACTIDRLTGGNCAWQCSRTTITACTGGDGCCASGCSAANDYDCAGDCGDCALDCRNDATWPAAWRYFEDQVLALTNQRRAAGASCGGTWYPPVAALAFDPLLRVAARCHVYDMATNDFFDHVGSDGSDVGDRINAAGYDWLHAGENIGVGGVTPSQMVEAWMGSTGHCESIMSPHFTELGAAYMALTDSTWFTYWGQAFATPAP